MIIYILIRTNHQLSEIGRFSLLNPIIAQILIFRIDTIIFIIHKKKSQLFFEFLCIILLFFSIKIQNMTFERILLHSLWKFYTKCDSFIVELFDYSSFKPSKVFLISLSGKSLGNIEQTTLPLNTAWRKPVIEPLYSK